MIVGKFLLSWESYVGKLWFPRLVVINIKRFSGNYDSRELILVHFLAKTVRDINFNRIIYIIDITCIENTRMDRKSFYKLCELLKTIGKLVPTKIMGVEEQVAIFLHIWAHDVENSVIER